MAQKAKWEYFRAIYQRYRSAAPPFGYIANDPTTPATVTFLNGLTRLWHQFMLTTVSRAQVARPARSVRQCPPPLV
jgi:hypothetical protein